MTPEQRETLDELVLSMIAALNHEQINYGGRYSTVTVDGSDLDALRAALAAPTCGTCEQLLAERDEARALHQELMFQVGKKYPGETPHETAKRYIREHEHCGQGGPAYATEPTR